MIAVTARWARSVKPRRWIAFARCLLPLRRGTAVVIVNFNSIECLRVTVRAVQELSPASTRLLVVDNGSIDGSGQWLVQHGIKVLETGANIGHGAAADIGVLSTRCRSFVLLDVDAFPISPDWLGALLDPLRSTARVSGARGGEVIDRLALSPEGRWGGRDFVHPCALAMRLRRFVYRSHSFRKVYEDGRLVEDVGVRISKREAPHLHMIDPTSHIGPGALGTVFGDVVYHNFFGTRHRSDESNVQEGVTLAQSRSAWNQAVATYRNQR